MDYIWTKYGTVLPKKLQENEISLDSQLDLTTPIAVLFARIEDWKLFSKDVEGPFTDKKTLRSAYIFIKDTGLFNLTSDIWLDKPTSAQNWGNFKILFTKEAANIKHHINGSIVTNDEDDNYILQLSNAFAAKQQEIANMRAAQEQTANSASEYKDLKYKVDELMAKINSTKVQHQERVETPHRLNLKEPPRRTVALNYMIRMDTPSSTSSSM